MRDPCINCPEEERGCHSRCPYGIEWEKRQKARRERIKANRKKDAIYTNYKRETVDKRVRKG